MKQTLLLLALCPMSVVLAETLGPYIQLNQTFGASEYKIKFHKVSGGGDFYLSSDFQSETSSLDLSTKNIWLKNEGDSALVLKGVNINNSKDVTNGITDTLYGILVEEGKVVIDNIDTGDLQSNLSIGTGRGNLEATLIIKNGSQVQTTARYNTIGANGSTGHLNIEGQDTAFITNQITCGSPQCLQANTSTVISGTELNYDGYSSKSTEGKYLVGYGIIEVSDGATMHVGKGNTDTSTNKLQIFNGEVNINSASLVMHDKTILSMDSSHGNIPIDDVPDSKSHLIVKNGGSLKTAESAKLSTLAIGRSFHDNKADSKIEVSGENSLLDLSVSGICYVGGTGKKDLTAQGESTISLLAEDNGSAKITSDSYAVIAYNNTDSTTKQDVDIKASSGGSVELQTGTGVYIGSSTTNGRVNIEASGEASLVNISTDKELHINSGSADDFTVGINCTDGAKVSLTGKEGILMNQNTTVKVEGSGSTLMTSGDVTATASAITIGEGSTWDATGKITLKGTTLNNTGTLTATQLELSGGSIFDNSGKLSGSLTAVNGAKITGSGTFGSLVVKNGSTLVVGNSPGLQTVESLTIDSGSTTIFSVAGLELTDVATADTKGWDSGKYSSITMGESATLTIENGAVFAITFGGDKIFDPEQLSSESASLTKQFTLQLITGAGELTEETLTSLLQNTEFSITDESAGIPTAGNWEIDVTDAQYKIENNNLYLSGTMNARLVPEPTTATLSLLALAGLAARRRRR